MSTTTNNNKKQQIEQQQQQHTEQQQQIEQQQQQQETSCVTSASSSLDNQEQQQQQQHYASSSLSSSSLFLSSSSSSAVAVAAPSSGGGLITRTNRLITTTTTTTTADTATTSKNNNKNKKIVSSKNTSQHQVLSSRNTTNTTTATGTAITTTARTTKERKSSSKKKKKGGRASSSSNLLSLWNSLISATLICIFCVGWIWQPQPQPQEGGMYDDTSSSATTISHYMFLKNPTSSAEELQQPTSGISGSRRTRTTTESITTTATSSSSSSSDTSSSNNNNTNNSNSNSDSDSDNKTFAGCLLVMDDNHFLIEWIAYHYHVLPLRHLIIAIDPRSTTSPNPILHRWTNNTKEANKNTNKNNHNNIDDNSNDNNNETKSSSYISNNDYMSITRWDDDDYMSYNERISAEHIVRTYFKTIDEKVVIHRARQRMFYYKCLQQHKQNNRHWTILIDTDEFIRINYKTAQAQTQQQQAQHQPSSSSIIPATTVPLPSMKQPGSIMMALEQQLKNPYHNVTLSSPCVQIPRSRFGAKEEAKAKDNVLLIQQQHQHQQQAAAAVEAAAVEGIFNYSHFQTLRWKYHSDPNDYFTNRISKVMIDLSRVSMSEIVPVDSIHRPIKSLCSQRKLHIRAHEMIFVIHHYIGTYEQYNYRDDARLGNERSQQLYHKSADVSYDNDDYITSWIDGFVNVHGIETSKQLLQNVGQLEERQQQRRRRRKHRKKRRQQHSL